MSPLRRMLVSALERVLGRYYEGPDTPERFAERARLFRIEHHNATPDEWEGFASRLAANAYGQGWLRGVQHRERWREDEPDWSLAARGVKLPDPNEAERAELEALVQAVQESGHTMVWRPDDE